MSRSGSTRRASPSSRRIHFINHGGIGDGRLPRDARRRRVRRARRRQDLSRLPRRRGRRRRRRCVAEGGALRAAPRPGPERRRSASSPATRPATRRSAGVRLPRLPQAVPAKPHRVRRQVPGTRRPRDPRQHRRRSRSTTRRTSSRRSCAINRDLRRQNNATIAALAAKTSPKMLWKGLFKQLVNTRSNRASPISAPTSTAARKSTSRCTSASTWRRLAARRCRRERRRRRSRRFLGIYGNCVIVDHGMGLQSLYAHLSSFDVKVGDVGGTGPDARPQRHDRPRRRRSPALHHAARRPAVTPVDWWSEQWIEDRIMRKLREAGRRHRDSTGPREAV